eukprot:3190207-Rhodomonas_salina.2
MSSYQHATSHLAPLKGRMCSRRAKKMDLVSPRMQADEIIPQRRQASAFPACQLRNVFVNHVMVCMQTPTPLWDCTQGVG